MTLIDRILTQNGQPITGRVQSPRVAYYIAHSIMEYEIFPLNKVPVNGKDIYLMRVHTGMHITYRGGDENKPLCVTLVEDKLNGQVVVNCAIQGSDLKASAELSENFTAEDLAEFTEKLRAMLLDMLNVYTA